MTPTLHASTSTAGISIQHGVPTGGGVHDSASAISPKPNKSKNPRIQESNIQNPSLKPIPSEISIPSDQFSIPPKMTAQASQRYLYLLSYSPSDITPPASPHQSPNHNCFPKPVCSSMPVWTSGGREGWASALTDQSVHGVPRR